MSIDLDRIGRRIAEERKKVRHISQEKMAEDLGLYQADISNLERARKGSGITDLARLDNIARYFGIPLESLLFGDRRASALDALSGGTPVFRELGPEQPMDPRHRRQLARVTGQKEENIRAAGYLCGPCAIYILLERQGFLHTEDDGSLTPSDTLPVLHCFVFLEDRPVAAMTAPFTRVRDYLFHDPLYFLQRVVPGDALDVTDVLRTINPHLALTWFTDEDDPDFPALAAQADARTEALLPLAPEPVMLIESIYVLEDFRRKGLCRMLLDLLRHLFGPCTMWVNMEPTGGEELSPEAPNFPLYTQAEAGQLSQNAAVAERLGLTVDPDCWHRRVETTDSRGNPSTEVILVRKCAYILSPGVKDLCREDGDLVTLGRARQRLVQTYQPEEGGDVYLDIRFGKVDGQPAGELRTDDGGLILYEACVLTPDGPRFTAARQSIYSPQGIRSLLAEWSDPDTLPDGPYSDSWRLLWLALQSGGSDVIRDVGI